MSVRGYADWSPSGETRYWLRAAAQVLEQYREYWPLSVRQIFYRMVADHGFGKTEAQYNQLTGWLSRARRANMVPWDAIRDGGLGRGVPPTYWNSADAFMDSARRWASQMQVDRQAGQPQVVELWCEAGGMMPILQDIGEPYSCQVNTGGGYDSVTAKHKLAIRVAERAERGLRTVVLHVGDFDGSGENMCEVLTEDGGTMAMTQVLRHAYRCVKTENGDVFEHAPWDWLEPALLAPETDASLWRDACLWADRFLEVERVALTGEQVIERNVETAPPKKSDSRTRAFVNRNQWVADELGTDQISAQLEALTPPELHELISGAIEARLDMEIYEQRQDLEEEIREELAERLNR